MMSGRFARVSAGFDFEKVIPGYGVVKYVVT